MKVKVINLDRRPDRWERFIKTAQDNNITDYERVSGVDGNTIKITVDLMKLFRYNTFNWRAPVMGCALSHIKVWEDLVKSYDDLCLVLEDDVELTPNFQKFLPAFGSLKFPIVYLGYTVEREEILVLPRENELRIDKIIKSKNIWGGTFGYVIHRDFAQKLLTDIKKNGIQTPIDTFMMSYEEDIYVTTPRLARSDVMMTGKNIDSDIHYNLLGVFDDYVFFSGKDSVGGDIGGMWQYGAKFTGNVKITDVLNLVNNNDECVAFNTFGLMKNKVNHPKDFIQIPNFTFRLQGIYVKKDALPENYNEFL